MKLDILKETDAKLMSRTEVLAKISYEKETSSKEEIISALAKHFKKPAENILLTKVAPIVGTRDAKIEAFVYENKDLVERLTKKGKKEVEKIKKAEDEKVKKAEEAKKAADEAKAAKAAEKAAAQEAAPEEKSEEKPAEEKAEEKPEEKKESE